MKEATTGNFTPLVEISVIVSSVTQKKSNPLSKQLVKEINIENSRLLTEEESINFEIDKDCETNVHPLSSSVQEHHAFYKNVVAYMAGCVVTVVQKIRKVLKPSSVPVH